MKKHFSKAVSLLTAVIMLVGMLQIGAIAADVYSQNYNSQTFDATIVKNNSSYTQDFRAGLGGKSADDYSACLNVNDSAQGAFQVMRFADYGSTVGKYTKITYEFSMLYSGDADAMSFSVKTHCHPSNNNLRVETITPLSVSNGKVYVGGANTGINCNKDEWLRVALELDCNAQTSNIYVNGEQFSFSRSFDIIRWIEWFQLYGGMAATGDGSKSGIFALDDVKIYEGAYTVTGNESVDYTISDAYGAAEIGGSDDITVPQGTTVEQALASVTTENTKYMVDSVGSFSEITSGEVESGNTIILKSEDGLTFKYISINLQDGIIDYGDIAYESDFNTAELQSPTDKQIKLGNGHTYPITYPAAIGGRAAADHSMIETFPDSASSSGFEISSHYGWVQNAAIGSEATTMELSMLYDGAADYATLSSLINHHPTNYNMRNEVYEWVKISGGKVYVKGTDTGILCQKGEWLRVAVELHYAGNEYYVYVNGKKFTVPNGYGYIRINKWTQLQAGVNNAGDGSKNIIVGVDDIKIYNRAYTPTGKEAVSYTVNTSSAFQYIPQAKSAVINAGTTAADVLSAVVTSNAKEMHKSLSDPTAVTDGKAADGNVVVIKSEDGKSFDYLHLTTSQDCRIVFSDSMSTSSRFTSFGTGNETKIVNEGGLYTKAADDISFTLQSNIPAGTSLGYRTNYISDISTAMFDEDSFTYEFSLAFEGDMNEVSLANFVSDENTQRFAYNNPVRFKNGKIYVNDNGKDKFIRNYREKEWYRIGITYYPKELKQDIYVNGKKCIAKGWVVDDPTMRDPSAHKLTGFYWNNISVNYTENLDKVRTGKICVDDTRIYYGEHFDTADYQTQFESTDYATGGSIANDIYLDSDGIEIGEFAGGISFDIDNPPMFYTGNDYAEQAETVNYGTTLVFTSPNGLVKEYYVVLSPKTTIDNEIKCFVNGYEKKTFAAKADSDENYKSTLSASASAVAPAFETDAVGCLAIAVYKNGVLTKLVTDAKEIKSYTRFTVSCDITETDGITAKAMFMQSLASMKPYAPSRTFTAEAAE